MREQEKETEHDDDHGVSPGFHFHGFEGHEEDQQGNAGIPAKQGVELPADAGDSRHDKQGKRPAAGQMRILLPQPASPQQDACDQQRNPQREMLRVRSGRCHSNGQQPWDSGVFEFNDMFGGSFSHTTPALQDRWCDGHRLDPVRVQDPAGEVHNGHATARRR